LVCENPGDRLAWDSVNDLLCDLLVADVGGISERNQDFAPTETVFMQKRRPLYATAV
jgi:hypothetical protein